MDGFKCGVAAAALAFTTGASAADLAVRSGPAVAAPAAVLPSRSAAVAVAVPETYLRAGCPVGPLTEAGAARIPNDDCLPPRVLPVNHTRYIGWVPVVIQVERR